MNKEKEAEQIEETYVDPKSAVEILMDYLNTPIKKPDSE